MGTDRFDDDVEIIGFRAVYQDPKTGEYKRDLFWERLGAESGDPDAMAQMGYAYLLGDGVEKDPQKAREYFQKAAALGNSEGLSFINAYQAERNQVQSLQSDYDRAMQESIRQREEIEKKRAAEARQKEQTKRTIAIALMVIGAIMTIIGGIGAVQPGRDTSGWMFVIVPAVIAFSAGKYMLTKI